MIIERGVETYTLSVLKSSSFEAPVNRSRIQFFSEYEVAPLHKGVNYVLLSSIKTVNKHNGTVDNSSKILTPFGRLRRLSGIREFNNGMLSTEYSSEIPYVPSNGHSI